MNKLTLSELRDNETWKKAVIVFTKDSYSRDFSETQRSYEVSRDNKYFDPNMIGNSLFGSCLDGTDDDVRLDRYIHRLPEEGHVWKVEYCYITK